MKSTMFIQFANFKKYYTLDENIFKQ